MKPTDLQTQFDFDKEAREQAERVKHTKLEKDYSYFDSCRETMAEIEKTNRSAFFYTCFACFIIAFAFDRVDFLALGVGLVAVAIVVSYLDMGVFDRFMAFSSYSRHNIALSLFRG